MPTHSSMTIKQAAVACLGLVLASASVAHEHTTPGYMEMRQLQFIDRYDADGDERVSSVEFEQARRDRFDITDEDENGWVSRDEYVYEWEDRMDAQLETDREGQVKQTRVRFGAMDRDDDEQMSWEEYARSGDRMFTRHDVNEDGFVNADDPEPENTWANRRTEDTAEAKARRKSRMLAWGNRVLRMPTTHNREGIMTRYDADGDGNISREQFDTARRADFDRTDEDGNGSLSEDEYVLEYEDRVDTQMAVTREESVKQAGRRFEALDDDADQKMTFAEYQDSGHGMFARWDTSADGYVSVVDTIPEFRELVADNNQDDSDQDANADSSGGQ
ncbi:MAG: hypothetical protein AAF541_10645 [Pseudomonadota bacterium]